MTALAERDLRLWLTSKLDEPWSSSKISASFTKEIFQKILIHFPTLDPPIKLKLLFSLLALKKSSQQELKDEIQQLIELGKKDTSEWVRVISVLLTRIGEGVLGLQELQENTIFASVFEHLKNLLETETPIFYPMETPYLSHQLIDKKILEEKSLNPHFKVLKKSTRNSTLKKSGNLDAVAHVAPLSPVRPKVTLTRNNVAATKNGASAGLFAPKQKKTELKKTGPGMPSSHPRSHSSTPIIDVADHKSRKDENSMKISSNSAEDKDSKKRKRTLNNPTSEKLRTQPFNKTFMPTTAMDSPATQPSGGPPLTDSANALNLSMHFLQHYPQPPLPYPFFGGHPPSHSPFPMNPSPMTNNPTVPPTNPAPSGVATTNLSTHMPGNQVTAQLLSQALGGSRDHVVPGNPGPPVTPMGSTSFRPTLNLPTIAPPKSFTSSYITPPLPAQRSPST